MLDESFWESSVQLNGTYFWTTMSTTKICISEYKNIYKKDVNTLTVLLAVSRSTRGGTSVKRQDIEEVGVAVICGGFLVIPAASGNSLILEFGRYATIGSDNSAITTATNSVQGHCSLFFFYRAHSHHGVTYADFPKSANAGVSFGTTETERIIPLDVFLDVKHGNTFTLAFYFKCKTCFQIQPPQLALQSHFEKKPFFIHQLLFR